MKRGRPTSYDPKYCKEVIIWMSRGFSIKSFAGNIGVDETTIYDWISKHREFSQSIKIGKAKSVMFWEQMGMLGMMGKIPNFNTTVWIFQMKNRMGWSDRLTVDLEADRVQEQLDKETNLSGEENETPHETVIRLLKTYGREIYPDWGRVETLVMRALESDFKGYEDLIRT